MKFVIPVQKMFVELLNKIEVEIIRRASVALTAVKKKVMLKHGLHILRHMLQWISVHHGVHGNYVDPVYKPDPYY